jgi:hypothetical protein
MARPPVKVAEFAIRYTDIGGIGVAVDDPGDDMAGHLFLAERIAHIQERGRWSVLE